MVVKPLVAFAIIGFLVVLRDPVLMYATILAFQILLFPEMGWQTFAIGMFATMSIYMSHDLVLDDEKAFFVRVDRAIRGTTWLMLVLVSLGYAFSIVGKTMKWDAWGAWEVVQKAFPFLVVISINHVVDSQSDGGLFDNAMMAIEYGRTIMEYSVKYSQMGISFLFNSANRASPLQIASSVK